jgi:hypothetical protein
MKLKKSHLVVFLKAIKETDLGLADSRIRDEFFKPLFEETKNFEEAQQTIYKTLCKKDKDGNPEMTSLGQFQFEGENAKKVIEELDILSKEEVELTPKNTTKIKEFLENTSYKPKVGEADLLDDVLKLL